MTGKKLFIGLLVSLYCLIGVASSQSQPEWKRDMQEGDRYGNVRMFLHAISFYEKALANSAIKDSVYIQLRLLKNLTDCYDITGNGKLLVETNYKLRDLAKDNHAEAYLAMADFMTGKHNHFHGNKSDGYNLCLDALKRLKESNYDQKEKELGLFYAALTRMNLRDGHYAEAMRMSEAQEQAALQMQSSQDKARQRALYRVYGIRTHLYMLEGRMAEADSCYAASQQLGTRDFIADRDMAPYLSKSQKYQELLDNVKFAKQALQQDGDTCGLLMLYVLRDEADAYFGLNQYQEAANAFANSETVHDSINKEGSQILISTVREAVQQEHKLYRHNLILAIVIALGVLVLVVAGLLFYHDRLQNHRNRAMAQNIRKLIYYRDLVLSHQQKDSVEMEENKEQQADDAEKRLFVALDHRIMKEELFRNPDFGRDELMRLLGLDKNALATFINRHTGTNVSGYVNSKRMEYAVALMKDHPEYTMSAIAEACGIKSPATFIRNFKNTYGMTPSEYSKSIEELPPLQGETDS